MKPVALQDIEQQSLRPAKWVNLFMGVAGVTAALASHATALMLDGLFSGVNFLAALLAARVAQDLARAPDTRRPFGYEINEPMYVMFRSLVLTGIILVALFNALGKVVAYLRGEHIEEIILGPVVLYMVLMLVLCFGLAAWHHRHLLKSGRQSDLLKAERSAALVDGVLSAAAGTAFVLIALLKHTPLAFLTPISDSIVVTCLALYMIPQPIRAFREAALEVVGAAADPATCQRLTAAIEAGLQGEPFEVLDLAATKAGRSLFALVYIRPAHSVSARDLDRIRDAVQTGGESAVARIRTEVAFTERSPLRDGAPASPSDE